MHNLRHKTRPHSSDTSSNDSHKPSPQQSSGAVARTAEKPTGRRGHFKSRLGCFNCKRRRVKCNELRPFCSPCTRLGLTCSYPTASATSSGPRAALSTFTLEDLRFYHQFLMEAFPTLPLKANDVWMQAAAMSHSYEFLAHASLGLGATHLSQHGNVDYTAQALQHRVTAIKLVNEQLANPSTKPADADALFATILCLLAQSSLMPDSMMEYLTITRGGNLVITSIIPDLETTSVFKGLAMERHIDSLAKLVCEQPKDYDMIEGFRSSVMQLESLCRSQSELVYWATLMKSITCSRTSGVEAWTEFVALYVMPSGFGNDDYLAFIHPTNYIGHLLVIHMFLLDYVLGQSFIAKSNEPKFPGRKNIIISWARNLAESLPPEYQRYMEWPQQYCEVLAKRDARYLFTP